MSDRILVVDDHEQLRQSLGRLLMRAGFICQCASDVPEARAVLKQRSWDLVLCDINMPGGSGLALLREIVREDPATAVVMVTAAEGEDMAETAAEFGASAHITKPFTESQMLTTIASVLRRREMEHHSPDRGSRV
jgi:DNA-binding NtrC family response regulator